MGVDGQAGSGISAILSAGEVVDHTESLAQGRLRDGSDDCDKYKRDERCRAGAPRQMPTTTRDKVSEFPMIR
jgi:hypothetical protein